MKFISGCFVLVALIAGAATAASSEGPGVFSLLPRAFQKNPRVDFNVITEMTPEGRAAVQASPDAPIYYLSKPGAFVQRGRGAAAQEKPPAVERMEKMLEASLAKRGYLGANENHPPTVVIVYIWGSHTAPAPEDESTDPTISNHAIIDEMLERARLVGGEKFTNELIKAMADAGAAKSATAKPRVDSEEGGVPPQPDILGDVPGAMTQVFNPVDRFRRQNVKHQSLMEDAVGSIYFVVASAFDFESAKTNSKILLWRTKMSVRSDGLSMSETLPSLISAAGPYFGREMTEPEIVGQRIAREGKVKIGDATVVEDPKETSPNTPAQVPAPSAEKLDSKP